MLAAVALISATVLPLVLSLVLVERAGGAGVVRGTIWVANEGSDRITGIDAHTHAVVTVLHGAPAPHNVLAAPDGRTVWMTIPPLGLAAAVDADTLEIESTVATGGEPAHVVLTPEGQTALVTNAADDSLAIVDVARMKVRRRVRTGDHPHGVRVSPNGRLALVADMGGSTVTLVDLAAAAVRASIEVGRTPVQVAFGPDGRFAYVTLNGEDAVVKIDVARRRVVGRSSVARGPVQLAVTPDARMLVVASQGSRSRPVDKVSLLDAGTLRLSAVLTAGAGAHGVTIDPSGRHAYVTDVLAGDVAVIDLAARSVVDRIHVGGRPNGVSFSPRPQPHARGAANMDSPLELTLPLGGAVRGSAPGAHHHG
jgi:YVTN family beta-propeller protein